MQLAARVWTITRRNQARLQRAGKLLGKLSLLLSLHACGLPLRRTLFAGNVAAASAPSICHFTRRLRHSALRHTHSLRSEAAAERGRAFVTTSASR